jgi:hypothetical protein
LLVDAIQLVFDWILDCEDLAVRRVESKKRCVERCRLAASRRTGHKNDAVGTSEQRSKRCLKIVVKPKRLKIKRHGIAIKHTQNDALAVDRRTAGNAQVDLLAEHCKAQASILRKSSFGDIEPRHDLDARDDRGRLLPGPRLSLLEPAINAKAYPQAIDKRFEVNIGRACLDSFADQIVHEADDWGFACKIRQPVDILIAMLLGTRMALRCCGR